METGNLHVMYENFHEQAAQAQLVHFTHLAVLLPGRRGETEAFDLAPDCPSAGVAIPPVPLLRSKSGARRSNLSVVCNDEIRSCSKLFMLDSLRSLRVLHGIVLVEEWREYALRYW